MTESITSSGELSLGQKIDLCIEALPAQFRYVRHPLMGADPMDGLLKGIRELCVSFSETQELLETERLRLAACSTAALGYFDGCHEDYKSAALGDVLDVRKRLEEHARKLRESTDYAEALHHALSSEVVQAEYAGGVDQPQTGWYCSLCDETWGASGPAHAETCVLRRRTEIGTVIGVDKGSPDGDCTVKGYRDAEGRVHVTSVETGHAVGTIRENLLDADSLIACNMPELAREAISAAIGAINAGCHERAADILREVQGLHSQVSKQEPKA